MKCMYDYPFGHVVTSVSWSKLQQHVSGNWQLVPLRNPSSAPDHFEYVGNKRGKCDLEVNNVQLTDEGAYFFSFVTTFNTWRSKTYAYLSVKELTAVVRPSTVTEGDNVSLTCVSGCPDQLDVVWFRDGRPVSRPVFQARREDAGRYHCAVLSQETVRSASVALNVQYAPKNVMLSMSPSGDIIRGSTVTFTCSSDANPPVTQSGYSLYTDGQFLSSGQIHTISDVQPSHSGRYRCQARNNINWRGIDLVDSTEVHLDVHYSPMNITVSMDLQHVVKGSTVNLTCSSDANPAADKYTWYWRTASLSSSSVQVGSGQVLSLPSVEASDAGLYHCHVSSRMGENISAEVLLAIQEKQHDIEPLPVLAGVGVFLFVTLVIAALLLLWKKRTNADKKHAMFDFRPCGRGSSSAATEDPSDPIYTNIHMCPSSSLPVHHHASRSSEDEVTYSTVTIKPRNTSGPHHKTNSRDSGSKAESDASVIYATVVKSS
ncbi:B-cell receptor CD22-like [Brachyistius frenatus]|uniref:B-cell receptor CD22-like n=1 Tax=Brachyistius frenatus TaxID=100188 RepID=UPI0037E86991